VASASSNLQILNSTFSDNQAYRGGALYIINSDGITIENCSFINNTAFLSGGAVYFKDTNAIVMRRCSLDSNRATASSAVAGAIHFQKSSGDMILTTLRNNSAGAHGGAVAVTAQSTISIHNATFFGNRAQSRGGALFSNDSSSVDPILGSDFLNNTAATGGAIALYFSYSTIRNSTIQLNLARAIGGGVWSDLQTKLALESSNITLNMALIGIQMGCRNSCVWLDPKSSICAAAGADREFPSVDDLDSVSSQFETDNVQGSYRGITCDSCHFFDQSSSPCIPSSASTCAEPALGSCSWRRESPRLWSQPRPPSRSEHIMLSWRSGFIIHGGTFDNDTAVAQSTTYGKAVASRLAYSDVWYYDLLEQQWSRLDRDPPASAPIARWRHAAVMLDENSFLVRFCFLQLYLS
jgi:predicted outer membrane repeat protein